MAVARLAAISLDCADPAALASFYAELGGLTAIFGNDDFVALNGGGYTVTFQRVADHRPPTWPGSDVPKQLHLEFAAKDLDLAETAAIALGAVKADDQPRPESWRVMVDPAGHPFCLTNLIPDTL